MIKKCVECGREFETKWGGLLTCSKECAKTRERRMKRESNARYRQKDKPLISKKCPVCNVAFESRRANIITCSRACSRKWDATRFARKKNVAEQTVLACVVCGTTFQSTTVSLRTTCSRACQEKLLAINRQKNKEDSARSALFHVKSECPFPGMTTWTSEFPSWDCPEMDPLSCGSWSVPLDIAETTHRRKAA